MGLVERRVVDRQMLKLLRSWLRAGVFEGGVVSEVEAGTPQGSPVSPLLANIALHVLDEAWEQAGRRLGALIRFADDFVVLCPSRERAVAARDLAEATLAPLGLQLHPDKTKIVDLRRGAEGFEFLGFHHRMVESRKRRGRFWLNKWPSPRAMASIRGKVRALTAPSRVGADLDVIVEDLNPVLRGWGAYFRQGNSSAKFGAVDSYVHERMARLASRKYGIRGFNWSDRFTWGWLGDLGIYRLTGTVRYPTAHARR
jgi:group II intron reverse transcriptase/maturase